MASDILISFTPNSLPGFSSLLVFASGPLSQGISFPDRLFLIRVVKSTGLPIVSPINITTQYVARFGDAPIGSRIFVRAVVFSRTGIASIPIQNTSVVIEGS